jgi:hypothetical protein
LRQQYYDNKYEVFYFSKGITHLELFIEFFFEIMNEKSDPLIVVIEFIKFILRFKEYKSLIFKENINAYIELEAYKELKRLKEIKDNHFYLVRSKKKLPKIKNFKFSEKL